MPFSQHRFLISDDSQVGSARRFATRVAADVELSETQAGQVAIIVTELGKNLMRHAQGGELLIRGLNGEAGHGVEVLSIDHGPGMEDPSRCLRDGVSSRSTPGTGLGAVQRMSSDFDLHSTQPNGTVIVSRVRRSADVPLSRLELGTVCLPVHGETACGDAYGNAAYNGSEAICIADGTGHGPEAAAAADRAVATFRSFVAQGPRRVIEEAHTALRGTRGAAVAIAQINLAQGLVRFAGVGNIAASLASGGESRGLPSYGGIVGSNMRKSQEFDFPAGGDNLLVMHSDGLGTRWSLDAYPGLRQRHPSVVAGVLYRDFARGRDDVTVVAARWKSK